jgi:DNA-binding NtrC family response regulator/ligand-binding sensor domain-containing protein
MTEKISAENLFHHAVWRTYTPADGLAGLQLQEIAQDREGYLWFATFHSGVSRFDGEAFRTFTRDDGLAGNIVMPVLLDSRERLWFGSIDGGICWYDGQIFHRVDGLDQLRVRAGKIFEDEGGRIWFCGSRTLCYLDGDRVCDLRDELRRDCDLPPSQCWGIDQDGEGRIWLGMKHLVCYDDRRDIGSRFYAFGPEDGLNDRALAYAVGADASGDMWIGSWNHILRYDGCSFHSVEQREGLCVGAIRRDQEGRVWFCTNAGAFCNDGDRLYHLTMADGLVQNVIADVFQDREGLFWFSTWRGGVSCCDPHAIHHIGTDLDVRDLHEDSGGTTWLGAKRGLAALERESLDLARVEMGAEFGDICALCSDPNGGLWLGGSKGLAFWDGQQLRIVEQQEGFDDLLVTALLFDTERGLLLAHEDSERSEVRISLYDGCDFHSLLRRRKAFDLNIITRLLLSRDRRVWFALGGDDGQAFGESGIGCLDADGGVTLYGVEEGIVDFRVEDLSEDRRGHLWVATRGGVSCCDIRSGVDRQNVGERFRSFTPHDGLPVPGVLCVCEDRDGHFWFGADSGIVHYDSRRPVGSRFQLVRSPHLLGVRRIIQDGDGAFWCATVAGVVRYRPTQVAPRVHLQRVIADRSYEGADVSQVTSAGTQASFEYRGLSYRTPLRDLLYLCRLRGVDDDWCDSRQRQVTYTDLVPGKYVFEVKAIDRDLNESEPASCHLEIFPDPRVTALSRELGESGTVGEFVGGSSALRRVQMQLAQVADTDLTVLILGETGTGKGLAARTLHALSDRKDGPFIQINCGAIPSALIESELFGHEKGAFTGAVQRRLGKVELARGGTLFLDEIGDMPLEAQVKLLRLLEERNFERVGGSQTLDADARVVAATNRDLENMVAEERFREDLFYRLQVFPTRLSPLRERREDIPLLAVYFMERMAEHLSKRVDGFTPEGLAALRGYDWPGNVRELEHAVQRAVIVCGGAAIGPADLGLEGVGSDGDPLAEMIPPQEYERRYLEKILEQTDWTIKGPDGAAARLDMPVSTLRSRLRKLGIRRPGE